MTEVQLRRGRFSINRYEFQIGGVGDSYPVDFVNDPSQGLGVPAKSLLIINHAGGSGYNLLHFKLTENGSDWDGESTVEPGTNESYAPEDNCVFMGAVFWVDDPHVRFSIRATPGEWTLEELRKYMPTPAPSIEKKTALSLTDLVV